jgi:hypothetical protein
MPAERAEEPRIVTVGKVTDDSKAVWDRHPFHPSNYGSPLGEVFISDMRPYRVHRGSAGIRQKMNEEQITELTDAEAQERMDAYDEAQEQRSALREEMLAAREEAASSRTPGVTTVQPAQSPQPGQGGGYGAGTAPVNPIVNAPGGTGDPDPNQDHVNDEADRESREVDAASTEQGEPERDPSGRPIRRPARGERPER